MYYIIGEYGYKEHVCDDNCARQCEDCRSMVCLLDLDALSEWDLECKEPHEIWRCKRHKLQP